MSACCIVAILCSIFLAGVAATSSPESPLRSDSSSAPQTNFESELPSAEYARMYKEDGLRGGHIIMLGADSWSRQV